MQTSNLAFLRSPEARAVFGNLSTSTFYELIQKGLMPPGIFLSGRSVAWPAHELQAIAAARLGGQTEEELRALVKRLVADRAKFRKFVPSVPSPSEKLGTAQSQ